MRLGYFTMPLHPLERDTTETLHEDRQTIIFADQLGFYDAFVGEHLTDKAENVTNSLMFLATLIPETRQIKLGSGTSNLSHSHPTLIASQAAAWEAIKVGCECDKFEVPDPSLICRVSGIRVAKNIRLLVTFSALSVRCSPTKAS